MIQRVEYYLAHPQYYRDEWGRLPTQFCQPVRRGDVIRSDKGKFFEVISITHTFRTAKKRYKTVEIPQMEITIQRLTKL